MTTNFPRLRAIRFLLLTALMLAHFTAVAHADNLTRLYSFSTNYSSGSSPTSKLIQAPDGYFYGTTEYGGTGFGYGTIFRMSTLGTVTTLYSFDYSTTGRYPYGGLFRDTDGSFYGTSSSGGNGAGVVYKMTMSEVAGTPVAKVIPYYTFIAPLSVNDPANPLYGELIKGTDGKLYGATSLGGANNHGAVYSLTIVSAGTPTLTLLYSFNNGNNGGGYSPQSGVTEGSDGNLYGTTNLGGPNGAGVVYKLTKDGSIYTRVHDFTGNTDGSSPISQLTKSSSGDLYGVTPYGGIPGDGTLYKISSTGIYSTLYTFDGNAGQYPVSSPIVAADGKLYGVTQQGGPNEIGNSGTGVIYKYDLSSNVIAEFSAFDGINGYYPNAITQGTDGQFYGTSQYGGVTSDEAGFSYGDGSAFKVTSKGVISLLYSFYTHTGYAPSGRVVQGPDGLFYGTTYGGGFHNKGTIYKCDSIGNITILHHFNDSHPLYEGAYPATELTVGKDGYLYGTTNIGGVYGNGTIYKISTTGSFTVLYSHQGTKRIGGNVYGPLMQGSDKSFYGVCTNGGVNGYGFVFKLSGSTYTILHNFVNLNGQGIYPQYGLSQDGVGNLFGTTTKGGESGVGTIFELSTSGSSFNTVYSFASGSRGDLPLASLLYTGGTMYGTTSSGGASGSGTIYKFTPSTGSITPTVIHDFSLATDGYDTLYTLSLSADGKLYGTTYAGGINGGGTIYSLDVSNNFTTLYSFNNPPSINACNLQDSVIVGSDNNLYFTTQTNGDFGYGTFDTIDISLHFAVKVSSSVTVTLGSLTLSGGTYNGTLTVKNKGTTTILGPLNVVLTGLTGGTTLVNKTGDVPSGYTESGSPYIQANPAGSAHGIFALGAGKSITIPVHFSANTGVNGASQTYLRRF